MLLEQFAHLTGKIMALSARIAEMSNAAETPRRLQTMPGVGPITALAVETFAPPMEQFRRERDFAAWLGLDSRIRSSRVVEVLSRLVPERDAPLTLRSDNEPDLVSRALLAWIFDQILRRR